ncbi:MAG: Uma2 family endonuclease [Gemmatimonadaceae bacterium]|nr:Uma2 family endonuclease [Gemmatimonadaceae bacterium]
MAMPALESRTWTVEEVQALPDDGNRYECIDGALFVSPAPAPRHQQALLELAVMLKQYAEREQHVGWVWIAPHDLVLGPRTVVQPDLQVHSAGPTATRKQRAARALLIVEVLSPSTARLDRQDKRKLYLRDATASYWIVDLAAELVEVWTPQDDRPHVVSDTLTWNPEGATAAFTLALPAFFTVANAWEHYPRT